MSSDEREVCTLIETWADAVRRRDMPAILASHSDQIVMFDVPPPFQSVGTDAYRATWELFFKGTTPGRFDIKTLQVVASDSVAFCIATMMCTWNNTERWENLDFRLTVGLRKLNGRWVVIHEHHSIPAP